MYLLLKQTGKQVHIEIEIKKKMFCVNTLGASEGIADVQWFLFDESKREKYYIIYSE